MWKVSCCARMPRLPAAERLPLHGGLVGYQLPKLQVRELPIHQGDLLVFVTDGIRHDFTRELRLDDPPQRIANYILERHFKGSDDALALVLRYRGERHE